MAIVGNLSVLVQAQTEQFRRGMRQMRVDLQGVQHQAQQTQRVFQNFTRNLTGLVAGFLAFGQIKALITDIVQVGIELHNLRQTFAAITGSTAAGTREFTFLVATSNRLGLSLQTLGQQYRQLFAATRGTSLAGQDTRNILEGIAEATRGFGLSTEQAGRALKAFTDLIGKGIVSQEELRQQLAEAIPGAAQIAARAFGVTTRELNEMVRKGLDSETFVRAFVGQLRREVPQATSIAGKGFTQLGNEIALLKDAIAQSGLLQFLDEAASKLGRLLGSIRAGIATEAVQRFPRASQALGPLDIAQVRREDLAKLELISREMESIARRRAIILQPTRGNFLERLLGRVQPQAAQEGMIQSLDALMDKLAGEQAHILGRLSMEQSMQQGLAGAAQRVSRTEGLQRPQEREALKAAFFDIVDLAEQQQDAEEQIAGFRRSYLQIFERLDDRQTQYVQSLRDEHDQMTLSREELERKRLAQEPLTLAARAEASALLAQNQALREQQHVRNRLAEIRARVAQEQADQREADLQKLATVATRAADLVTDSLIDMAASGRLSLQSLQESFTRFTLQVLADALQIRETLTNLFRKGLEAGIDALPGLFGTTPSAAGDGGEPRQHGGPVFAGRAYRVGERGPELFVPRQAGTILPAGAQPTVNIYVSTPDVASFRASDRQIARRASSAFAHALRGG
jgi:tape measure domain-containing protein